MNYIVHVYIDNENNKFYSTEKMNKNHYVHVVNATSDKKAIEKVKNDEYDFKQKRLDIIQQTKWTVLFTCLVLLLFMFGILISNLF